MARCFISFLGVNDYVRCNYLLNEARVDGVRFVQSALLKLVAADFTAEDSVLIGCTAKARATNLESLIDELADAGWAGPKPAVVDLPEATSERELWEIFQILMDRVRIGDE
ncbi:TM1812 family CRISPR-associated protein, partial [Thiorhodococcus minor]